MNRPYFEETQTFRDSRWLWIVVVISFLVTLLPLADGLYWQLVRGEPWGDRPLSDGGLLALSAFVLATWVLAMAVLISFRLDVRIDDSGVHYRVVPIKMNWQTAGKEQILNYSIEKKFRLLQAGGFGYHRNRFTGTRSVRIRGGHHLKLLLKNGNTLLLGTQNPGELEMAMKKLISK
jgi:hypothetical protein